MDKLRARVEALIRELDDAGDVLAALKSLTSVYPFNQYEAMICALLARERLTWQDYLSLRDEYLARNPYLHLFEISAPRAFGETWAHRHLTDLAPELQKASMKLDPSYTRQQYDLWLDGGVRIEVKASRAVDADRDGPLYAKALSSRSSARFDMNLQQVKCDCCEVFIWVAVWRDRIRYWVLNADEVAANPCYSPRQHRGNVGEGQLHLNRENVADFAQYETTPPQLLDAVRAAHERLHPA